MGLGHADRLLPVRCPARRGGRRSRHNHRCLDLRALLQPVLVCSSCRAELVRIVAAVGEWTMAGVWAVSAFGLGMTGLGAATTQFLRRRGGLGSALRSPRPTDLRGRSPTCPPATGGTATATTRPSGRRATPGCWTTALYCRFAAPTVTRNCGATTPGNSSPR